MGIDARGDLESAQTHDVARKGPSRIRIIATRARRSFSKLAIGDAAELRHILTGFSSLAVPVPVLQTELSLLFITTRSNNLIAIYPQIQSSTLLIRSIAPTPTSPLNSFSRSSGGMLTNLPRPQVLSDSDLPTEVTPS